MIDGCFAVCVSVGNPFAFMVNDPNRVTVRGDGLGQIQSGQQTSFTIIAPGAQLRDLDVRVTGMFHSQLLLRYRYFIILFLSKLGHYKF